MSVQVGGGGGYTERDLKRIGWAWNTQLLFAVLFHDVYYEIGLKSGRNEALSARMAYDVAKTCYAFDEGDCMAIRNAVNHTANFMHRIDGISELDQMISELDLSSLAREQRNDFTYQQLGIAAEQKECDPADLDREQCLKGSGAFLKAMLESRGGRIYYTQEADAIWGDKAVENIKALANEYPV